MTLAVVHGRNLGPKYYRFAQVLPGNLPGMAVPVEESMGPA